MPEDDEQEKSGAEGLARFFKSNEERWAFTNTMLRTIIRHAATLSDDPGRFIAGVFDDASLLVDVTTDKGADPEIGNDLHAFIDALAACVADDLRDFPTRRPPGRKPRGNGPKAPSSEPRRRR